MCDMEHPLVFTHGVDNYGVLASTTKPRGTMSFCTVAADPTSDRPFDNGSYPCGAAEPSLAMKQEERISWYGRPLLGMISTTLRTSTSTVGRVGCNLVQEGSWVPCGYRKT